MSAARGRGLLRAAGLVSLATLVSRLLGVLRDGVRAALVGASALSDSLEVAFRVPNLLRDLFAEGAFTGAFVPTLAGAHERGGSRATFEVLNRVLGTILVHVGGVVLLLVLFAPQVVDLLTADSFTADPEARARTVFLVRLLAPFLLWISLAVAAMGALNVLGRYFLPALSPATQNLVLVAGGAALLLAGTTAERATLPWALLLLLGGAAQCAVQLPALWRLGWRPRLSADPLLKTPEVREILRRMGPVTLALAATHLSILVNTRLASHAEGPISWLYYGFRLIHLPVGLVGVAVGTAVLAQASRLAAAGDAPGVRRTLAEALRLNLTVSMPAAAGLFALADPIARLLFQWRNVTPAEAGEIAAGIRCFSLAVVFYSSVKVVVPVFHAQGRMRVPAIASLAAVAANLACALSLFPTGLGWRALALAVGAGQAANLLVLLLVARRMYGGGGRETLLPLARIAAASAACGAAAWGASLLLPAAARGLGGRLLAALLPVAAGGAAFVVAAAALGLPEFATLVRRWRSRRVDKAAGGG